MNEAEWHRSEVDWVAWQGEEAELASLLRKSLRAVGGGGKRRRFANACARRLQDLIRDDRIRGIIGLSERFACGDPTVTAADLNYECLAAEMAWKYDVNGPPRLASEVYALQAFAALRSELCVHAVSRVTLAAVGRAAEEANGPFTRYYEAGVTDPNDCLIVYAATVDENRRQRQDLIDLFGK